MKLYNMVKCGVCILTVACIFSSNQLYGAAHSSAGSVVAAAGAGVSVVAGAAVMSRATVSVTQCDALKTDVRPQVSSPQVGGVATGAGVSVVKPTHLRSLSRFLYYD